MYKVTVPVIYDSIPKRGAEKILEQLKGLDAERVFLGLGRYPAEGSAREEYLAVVKKNCEFYKAHGYEVGAWSWTFWLNGNTQFQNKVSAAGNEIKDCICPADPGFVEFVAEYIKQICKCGVDLIFFDDDFRYGCLDETPTCLCPLHLKMIEKTLGREVTREEVKEHIVSGGPSEYRDAYLKANGDAFRNFAAKIREAVNTVDPKIRIGFCACMTAWDVDGTDAAELAHILAGDTQPLVRLIGAPYWAAHNHWGNCLQDLIELGRMESVWTRKGDIEIMAEGDVYPRPRSLTPASYLEGFDTAFRAAGCTDGILKYGIDYFSNADYEDGYVKFHQRNRELYRQIQETFGGKTHRGVRVYEAMRKLPDMVLPTKVNTKVDLNFTLFSKAARTMAHNSIPTVYEGEGVCGIVFDENARHLPKEALNKGLILDIAAAEILTEQGVDVGLLEIGESYTVSESSAERFLEDQNHIRSQGPTVYQIQVSPKAEILSDMTLPQGVIPISYRYENEKGQRFLVLNINTRFGSDNLLKHYARSRQYATQIPWLGGEKLPAYTYGHPAMYLQCKEKDGVMAVGMWNYCADIAIEPVVELDKPYSGIRFINCSGRLEGDRVYLADIPAFGFAGFEVAE